MIEAAIISIPPTIAALASWISARKAVAQTNGALHGPLQEMRSDLADVKADVRDLKADVRELKQR